MDLGDHETRRIKSRRQGTEKQTKNGPTQNPLKQGPVKQEHHNTPHVHDAPHVGVSANKNIDLF